MKDRADDPRWRLAQRIAESGSLGRSRLLAEFLLYIVDRHIQGRAAEITERQIGVLVFGRTEDYDVSEDNIVRSYARNLRKRVDEYFASEGHDEGLQLQIPRGGYTPVFSARAQAVESVFRPLLQRDSEDEDQNESAFTPAFPMAAAKASPSLQKEQPRSVGASIRAKLSEAIRRYPWVWTLCFGVALGMAIAVCFPSKLLQHTVASSAEAKSAALWDQLFSNRRDTFVVPSDDGLIIMQAVTARPVSLNSYIDRSYRTNSKADNVPGAAEIRKLGSRRYTSAVDLDFVALLAQQEKVSAGRMVVRYARDLSMDDLRVGNAILIGSIESNPWIELFEPRMNFRYSINAGNDKPSGILNRSPRRGELAIYGTPSPDHTYGLIAYVPNLTSTGHVLIVGGLNTAGTEAATTYLLNPSLMMPTLQRAKASRGGFHDFEMLIGAGSFATNAATPQLIAERIGP